MFRTRTKYCYSKRKNRAAVLGVLVRWFKRRREKHKKSSRPPPARSRLFGLAWRRLAQHCCRLACHVPRPEWIASTAAGRHNAAAQRLTHACCFVPCAGACRAWRKYVGVMVWWMRPSALSAVLPSCALICGGVLSFLRIQTRLVYILKLL